MEQVYGHDFYRLTGNGPVIRIYSAERKPLPLWAENAIIAIKAAAYILGGAVALWTIWAGATVAFGMDALVARGLL